MSGVFLYPSVRPAGRQTGRMLRWNTVF